ncbi:MAG: alpha-galactosidase [Kiritimatiellae bacterium]|nr:alpha-galactosidase [Kiritimatiellia bacterium]
MKGVASSIALSALLTLSAAAGQVGACDVWDIFGDFGHVEGSARQVGGTFSIEEKGVRIETTVEVGTEGVCHRRTTVRNVSGGPLSATCLLDVFKLGCGDFEVYTQANTWMDESRGAWQPLHVAVETRSGGMRTAFGAAPVLALWNPQIGQGRVFHLMPDSAWEMRAAVVPEDGGKTHVVVEAGVDSRHLCHVLQPGEEVALPEVVYYDFANKLDMDCHKLHAWWNEKHPCRRSPSFYNTWLCRFDRLELDLVLKQVDRAKDLGLEYFVVDAGWFGPAKCWANVRGDWRESPDGRLGGRLADVSAAVRAAGMKFGFWLEAEVADSGTEVANAHPEYFRQLRGGRYLDFTRDDACSYLLEAVCAIVKKYNAEFIKFDFNSDPVCDPSGRGFADYNAGYRRFIRDVRARNPGIYLEGCASGGLMMDLGWARDFDSFWLSDNQSPVYGMRIAKETMLRLPPHKIERWITVRSASGLQPDYWENDSRLVATEDAWWRDLRSVAPDYVSAFASGGPVGFSCDLTALSDVHAECFRRMVAARKKDEAFWCVAVGRILCDTPEVAALQYSDSGLRDVRVIVTTRRPRQNSTMVRPVLAPEPEYEHMGQRRKGALWMEHGVEVQTGLFTAAELRFTAERTDGEK